MELCFVLINSIGRYPYTGQAAARIRDDAKGRYIYELCMPLQGYGIGEWEDIRWTITGIMHNVNVRVLGS